MEEIKWKGSKMAVFQVESENLLGMLAEIVKEYDRSEIIAAAIFLAPIVLVCSFVLSAPFIQTYLASFVSVALIDICRKLYSRSRN